MKKYIVIIFALLMCGCGFHPRGVMIAGSPGANAVANLNGKKIFVASNNFTGFAGPLMNMLRNYNVDVVNDEKDAEYIINIQNAGNRQQLTSIVGGASNNTYQLIYSTTYNVVKPNDDTPVIPDKTISQQQFWQSNSTIQLSQNEEAARIINTLQSQVINNMIMQIATLLPSDVSNDKKDVDTDPSYDIQVPMSPNN